MSRFSACAAFVLLGLAVFHAATWRTETKTPPAGLPASHAAAQQSENFTVLRNAAFTVHYNEDMKNPAYVSYQLNQADRLASPPSRPHIPFQTDTRTKARVDSRDFSHSGFDRGHMAPSHAIGAFFGPDAQAETFRLSNISPQNHKTSQQPHPKGCGLLTRLMH